MDIDIDKLAEDLGDSLIKRAKKYLNDEVDSSFLKEIAREMAQLQAQALIAATPEEAELAKEDLGFLQARIDTFIAMQALKVRSEAKEAFKEVLDTIGEIIEMVANAALDALLRRT